MQDREYAARIEAVKQRAHGRWTEILASLGEQSLVRLEVPQGVLPGGHDLLKERLVLLIEPGFQTGLEGIDLGLIHGSGVAHQGLDKGWTQGYPNPGLFPSAGN